MAPLPAVQHAVKTEVHIGQNGCSAARKRQVEKSTPKENEDKSHGGHGRQSNGLMNGSMRQNNGSADINSNVKKSSKAMKVLGGAGEPQQYPVMTMDDVRSDPRPLVTRHGKVYDLSTFLSVHPGGEGLLSRWHGKDVEHIMSSQVSNQHSRDTYYYLESMQVGRLVESGGQVERQADSEWSQWPPTGPVSGECDMSSRQVELEARVDWSRGMVAQVAALGGDYFEWCHMPVNWHMKLFDVDWFEKYFTVSYWYVVLAIYVPLSLGLLGHGLLTSPLDNTWTNMLLYPLLFLLGVFTWLAFEGPGHRYLFHFVPPASMPWLNTIHFLAHGIHHKVPNDLDRIVMPPLLSLGLMSAGYMVFYGLFMGGCMWLRHVFMAGVLVGYMFYDLTHYYVHKGTPEFEWLRRNKAYHMKHHFVYQDIGFGVTNPYLYDKLAGTEIPLTKKY